MPPRLCMALYFGGAFVSIKGRQVAFDNSPFVCRREQAGAEQMAAAAAGPVKSVKEGIQ